jgi:hypothetical protein
MYTVSFVLHINNSVVVVGFPDIDTPMLRYVTSTCGTSYFVTSPHCYKANVLEYVMHCVKISNKLCHDCNVISVS